jgi:membrane protein
MYVAAHFRVAWVLGYLWQPWRMTIQSLFVSITRFPWRNTAAVLWERFRDDRLGVTASSLTFTTVTALVPLFTVALAVFSAFPMFAKLQGSLQTWLVQSLVPDAIARQVLGYLTQFAGKASRLGVVGVAGLLVMALALMLTIDGTLNSIWRVKRRRSLAQRVLVYWAALTLGPLLLAASLALTTYVVSASSGVVNVLPGGVRLLLSTLELVLLSTGLMALYRYVPHTEVRAAHAWAGGVFAAVGIELAKKVLAAYLGQVPTYSAVYGAFATVPILLLWIYVVWLIVLFGAVIAAYLPSLLMGVQRRGGSPGWPFQLAIEVLQQLHADHLGHGKGLALPALASSLRVDSLQLAPVMETLLSLQWVGRLEALDGGGADSQTAYLLLVDAKTTALAPLVDSLLVANAPAMQGFWDGSRLKTQTLSEAL